MFLGQGASGGNAREAFHQGILLCCALLAAALLAGGADAVRIAMAGRKARAAVARSEKESTTTALAPVPAEPADA
jgi:hypothetical protein